jgi:hypothetical protein
MIIAFVLFIIYVTVSWRILESYYMLCEPMHCDLMYCDLMSCDTMSCENFAKNEDLEWNA